MGHRKKNRRPQLSAGACWLSWGLGNGVLSPRNLMLLGRGGAEMAGTGRPGSRVLPVNWQSGSAGALKPERCGFKSCMSTYYLGHLGTITSSSEFSILRVGSGGVLRLSLRGLLKRSETSWRRAPQSFPILSLVLLSTSGSKACRLQSHSDRPLSFTSLMVSSRLHSLSEPCFLHLQNGQENKHLHLPVVLGSSWAAAGEATGTVPGPQPVPCMWQLHLPSLSELLLVFQPFLVR